jgi:uncharacterized protein involved in exopolysaccharide biosynthesis
MEEIASYLRNQLNELRRLVRDFKNEDVMTHMDAIAKEANAFEARIAEELKRVMSKYENPKIIN